jgi:hypothetical protein
MQYLKISFDLIYFADMFWGKFRENSFGTNWRCWYLVINRSSIFRCHKYLREKHQKKTTWKFPKKKVGTVMGNFREKWFPFIFGKENVDRLPIVISFDENEQLLCIPFIKSGTGKDQALAVYNILEGVIEVLVENV